MSGSVVDGTIEVMEFDRHKNAYMLAGKEIVENMISGIEWIIVAIIIVVLLLWGPSQLPKIAKALGEAKREFQKATKETEQVAKEVTQPFSETIAAASEEAKKADDKLLEIARSLGISTEGKTRDQIADEIMKIVKKS